MKAVVNALTDVPEPLRGEYEERGGKFVLKLEGELPNYAPLVEANTKLAEFRDNNRALNAQKTELETKLKTFEGVDPAEYATLKTRIKDFEKKGVKGGDDINEMLKAAVKAAVEPLEQKLAQREQSEAAARADLIRKDVESQLRDAGVKAGVDERAMRDYIQRGLDVFKIVDGRAEARNGERPIFSKTKPSETLSMEEWAAELQVEAPHLFKPSKGGGSSNSGGPVVKKTISNDPLEFGRNLESIAKGETVVGA